MGFLQRLMGSATPTAASQAPAVRSEGPGAVFLDLSDVRVVELLRGTLETGAGITVTVEKALKNSTVFRCVDLICGTLAMLPLNLHRETADGDFVKATDHPLHRIFRRRPNSWQTPFEFKGLMQYRALVHDKGAVALIVRSRGRVMELLPLNPDRVEISINDSFEVQYTYNRKGGGRIKLDPSEVFHLRGLTFDGINGISRVRLAAEAIAISIAAERATAAMFRNGTFAGGVLEIPQELSPEAFERLKGEWSERHSGSENAGSTPIMEGGAKYTPHAMSARDAQSAENRRFQVEEILRVFGVPRPLAMMDDTGWGTGIEQLSIGFVRFGMNPWFTAWQEAIGRMLGDDEDDVEAKFNPGALLNGTMKDQYDAFAKAAGAGGHRPWATPNDIRKLLNWPRHPDGDGLIAGAAVVTPEPADPDEDTAADEAASKLLKARKARKAEDDDD